MVRSNLETARRGRRTCAGTTHSRMHAQGGWVPGGAQRTSGWRASRAGLGHRIELLGDSMRKGRGNPNTWLLSVGRQQPNSIVVGQVNYAFRADGHTGWKDRRQERRAIVSVTRIMISGYGVDHAIFSYLTDPPVCARDRPRLKLRSAM